MLCAQCKKNPAAMHYVSIVNGHKAEYDLCQECASALGMASFSPFSWGDLFPHTIPSTQNSICCGKCKLTLEEFKRLGLLGCEQCYHDLRSGIEPIIRQVQKGDTHTGRTPMGFEAAKLPRPGQTFTQENKEASKEEELLAQMREAILQEDFEKAAELRDQIKAWKQSGTDSMDAGQEQSEGEQSGAGQSPQ